MNRVSTLVVLLCLFVLSGNAAAQNYNVSNVHFNVVDNIVKIHYNLSGELEQYYDVSLRLSPDGGKTFPIIPTALSGQVGKKLAPGENYVILWDYMVDFPGGLAGTDYVFEVRVQEHKFKNRWPLYALGLATGAAVLYFARESEPVPEKGSLKVSVPVYTEY